MGDGSRSRNVSENVPSPTLIPPPRIVIAEPSSPEELGEDQPPVSPKSYDTVLCLSILEHCQSPEKLMKNLRDALADGGTAFIVTPFAYIDGHCRPDYWRFGRDGLTLLAQQAGFRNIQTGTLGDVGPMLESVLGLPLAACREHDGIPLLTCQIAGV